MILHSCCSFENNVWDVGGRVGENEQAERLDRRLYPVKANDVLSRVLELKEVRIRF